MATTPKADGMSKSGRGSHLLDIQLGSLLVLCQKQVVDLLIADFQHACAQPNLLFAVDLLCYSAGPSTSCCHLTITVVVGSLLGPQLCGGHSCQLCQQLRFASASLHCQPKLTMQGTPKLLDFTHADA